jgi:outer membrane lipoprotein-sorting protein
MDHDADVIGGHPAPRRRLGPMARWAVPGIAVLAVGGVVAGTAAAGAQNAPSLPARSAAQLLNDVASAGTPGPFSGTVQESANLGLPALPSGDGSSGFSALSGTHTFNVWYADPAHLRLSEPSQLGESDLRVGGQQVWLWNSSTQTATHLVAPAELPQARALPRSFIIRPGVAHRTRLTPAQLRKLLRSAKLPRPIMVPSKLRTQLRHQLQAHPAFRLPPSPLAAAWDTVAALAPSTRISVQRNVMVAGQAAYQVALTPKASGSTIGSIDVAIDARNHMPLRVQVFARGSASPAFQIGFTSLTFGRPAASNFSFTPPPGAKVRTASPLAGAFGPPLGLLSPAQRLKGIAGGAWLPYGPSPVAQPTVMGKAWLSVLVIRPGASSPTAIYSGTSSAGTHVTYSSHSSSSGGVSEQSSSVVVLNASTGRAQAPLSAFGPAGIPGAVLRAATPVRGAWGSGRLLHTTLVNVLITSNGTVLAGAVQPSVLYADAAAVK